MIIPLADNWRIKTIPLNFVLEEQIDAHDKDKNPVKRWVIRGYYSGMDSALQALPDHLALSPSVGTYEEYLAAWGDLRRQAVENLAP